MRIRYVIPVIRPLIVPDHWEIPLQGGRLRLLESAGNVVSIEVAFDGQPVERAPRFRSEGGGFTLVNDDGGLELVKSKLADAVAFLNCYFDVSIDWDEAEAFYEAESPEEESSIEVKSFKAGRHVPVLPLSFDLIARAIFCAEKNRGPAFEATLVATARRAMGEQRYIDSFRYSFLLIEAMYGGGQFKSASLKAVLKASSEFSAIVKDASSHIATYDATRIGGLPKLLSIAGDVDSLIDHLVDQRGIFFHSNVKRKDAWRPEEQRGAHALAAFSALVAQGISMKAAEQMYAREFEVQYLDVASKSGAKTVYVVRYDFIAIGESFVRTQELIVNMPGTKPTPSAVLELTKLFIKHFEEMAPMGDLQRARCVIQGTNQPVFDMAFTVSPNHGKE